MGAMDTLRIEGLMVDCVVGVYPHERDAPQPLRVDVDLEFDMSAAADERLHETVDYAQLSAQIIFVLRSARFRLLETAAVTIAKLALAPPCPAERRAQVEAARVRVTKPGALRGFAIPSIEIRRERAWADAERNVVTRPFGDVETLHETKHIAIHRVHVAPGATLEADVARPMRGTEYALTDGLTSEGEALPVGAIQRWPADATRRYENTADTPQSLLWVDKPAGPLRG